MSSALSDSRVGRRRALDALREGLLRESQREESQSREKKLRQHGRASWRDAGTRR